MANPIIRSKTEKVFDILLIDEVKRKTNNQYFFLKGNRLAHRTSGFGLKAIVQNWLKQYGSVYNFLINIFSPVLANFVVNKKIKKILNKYAKNGIVINIGSGPTHFMGDKNIINLDIFNFKEVDIIADAINLPIKENSVDVVINIAMLEHVINPKAVISEIFRVTKYKGIVICYLPFMVPYHTAPSDFYRWTKSGAKALFSKFSTVSLYIGGGPTSAFLWIFQEFLAVMFSFGSKTIHDIVFLFFMMLISPFKLLDIFLTKLPYAQNIASGFYVIAKK